MPDPTRAAPDGRSAGDPALLADLSDAAAPATVRDAMLHGPKTLPADGTVADAVAAFAGGHVHMLLLTDGPTLVGTLVVADLPAGAEAGAAGAGPALRHATLDGRTVPPDALVDDALRAMAGRGLRRLAVVGRDGELLGLMCLKRRGDGFCSDEDVASRAGDRPTR